MLATMLARGGPDRRMRVGGQILLRGVGRPVGGGHEGGKENRDDSVGERGGGGGGACLAEAKELARWLREEARSRSEEREQRRWRAWLVGRDERWLMAGRRTEGDKRGLWRHPIGHCPRLSVRLLRGGKLSPANRHRFDRVMPPHTCSLSLFLSEEETERV